MLSNREIDKLMALEVMGRKGREYSLTEIINWRPTEDMNQAMACAKEFLKSDDDWELTLTWDVDEWMVNIWKEDNHGGTYDNQLEIEPLASLAICKALLKAKGVLNE